MSRNGVVALVLLVVGVFAVAYYTSGPRPPGNVLVVGDSLTAQSSGQIKQVLDEDGWTTTVVAEPGAGIPAIRAKMVTALRAPSARDTSRSRPSWRTRRAAR